MYNIDYTNSFLLLFLFFFFNDTATTEIYTLSLTTLFRSWRVRRCAQLFLFDLDPGSGRAGRPHRNGRARRRSEEHTSELQSRFDLVCRLLLEKKKNQILSAACNIQAT